MKKLVKKGWHCDYDPEVLIYFEINDDNDNNFWQSSWYDIRDLDKETVDELRKQVLEVCNLNEIVVELSSNDIWEWAK